MMDDNHYQNLRVNCLNEHRPDYLNRCCRCGVGTLDSWAEHVLDLLDDIRRRHTPPLPERLRPVGNWSV